MIKKAVIVAAGLSSRLYPLTLEKPKGLLEVNEQAILKRSINILKSNGIKDISIVVGYKQEVIRETIGNDVKYALNPFYKQCNNMGSLWFAKAFVNDEPFIYLHGDIIYDEKILYSTLNEFSRRKNDIELVTDFGPTDEEAMKVMVDDNHLLIQSNKKISVDESAGEWTGIAYVNQSAELFSHIEQIMLSGKLNVYDTYAFTKMAQKGHKIYCSSTNNLPWIEVDFLEDYEEAQRMF